tara:strand:+ start:755 stop:3157 length:2403 start_codon:yes stop_codon:yes gene_type:complete
MAKIPLLQRRQTLPTTTGVPSPPVVLQQDTTGQALQSFGTAVSSIGENLLKARASAQVTQATLNATLKINELKEGIDTDGVLSWERNDPNALPPTAAPEDVRDRLDGIYTKATQGMSPAALELFNQKFSILSSKAQIEINRDATARENAEIVGTAITSLDVFIKEARKEESEVGWQMYKDLGVGAIDDLVEFKQMGAVQAAKLKSRFIQNMDKIKGERLNTDVVKVSADGIRSVSLNDTEADKKDRLKKLQTKLDAAVEFGAKTKDAAQKELEAYKFGIDNALAAAHIAEDPYHFLKEIKKPTFLPNLKGEKRVALAERAQNKIAHDERKTKSALLKEQAVFKRNLRNVVSALKSPGGVADELLAQFSDDEIRANIPDEDEAEAFILLRNNAENFRTKLEAIKGADQNVVHANLAKEFKAKAGEAAETLGEAAVSSIEARESATMQAVIKADLAERQKDPVAYIGRETSGDSDGLDVQDAFGVWRMAASNPSSNPNDIAIAYDNFAIAREAAYDRMGFPDHLRKKLPIGFIKDTIAFFNEKNPEQVAARLKNLKEQMGKDWNLMFSEMTDKGLPKNAGVLTVVEDSYALQRLTDVLKQEGGVQFLKDQLDSEVEPDTEKEITGLMKDMVEASGTSNRGMTASLRQAVLILAFDNIANGRDDPVETAYETVIGNVYQVINQSYVKGVIPRDKEIENPNLLVYGLKEWLKNPNNMAQIDISKFGHPNTTDDMRETLIRATANWTISPDGDNVQLRRAKGVPVKDKNGEDIIVPIANIDLSGPSPVTLKRLFAPFLPGAGKSE